MKMTLSLTLAAALVAHTSLAASDAETIQRNWPQWRGPTAKGVAPLAQPPVTWSETEHVKWKLKIPGLGTSTPIVWENQVFIVTAIPTGKKTEPAAPPAAAVPEPAVGEGEGRRRRGGGMRAEKPSEAYQFVVLAVDRTTGKIAWQKTAREEVPHEGHHRDHGFASASPVTDGEHLYASFGSRGIYCFDLKGELKWEKDLGDMQTRNAFGEGASPAVHGEFVVVSWDHEGEDFIVALDKRTGQERWRQKRDEPTTWSTPLIVEHEGKPQVVVSATNKIRSYDLATGAPVWESSGMTGNVVPTPVSDFGMLYAISGFRGASLLAIRLGKSGDLTDSSEAIAWRHSKSTPYVPSPLLYGDRLYFFAGNTGTLSCFDAKTGKPHFEAERISVGRTASDPQESKKAGFDEIRRDLLGGVYASPVGAADRLYLVGRDGKTVVIKNADKIEALATNKLEDKFDASAAIAGKELFLRGHEFLYCIAE